MIGGRTCHEPLTAGTLEGFEDPLMHCLDLEDPLMHCLDLEDPLMHFLDLEDPLTHCLVEVG